MSFKNFLTLLKEAAAAWQADNAPRLAAALAYYALFSLAPAILVAISVAGLVLGRQAAEGQLFTQIQGMVGEEGAQAVQTLLAAVNQPVSNVIMTAVGALAILYGASNLFGQLGEALNTVWKVPPDPEQGLMGFVKKRLSAFAMVVSIGLLLLISLFVSTAVTAVEAFLAHRLPGMMSWLPVIRLADLLFSFILITLLSGMIYKVLPNVRIAWRDVWVGAAITSLLFTISKFLIGLYLGRSGVSTAYGAAGSLIVLMLWIYYSAQIFLFGAEFTYVYANRFGTRIRSRAWQPEATPPTGQPEVAAAVPVREIAAKRVEARPPASPLSPILREYIERLPPVLRDQSLIPADAAYQVVLEGELARVWQRPSWLRPLFLLMERAGLMFAETGENIPSHIVITAGSEPDGRPYHLWRRAFQFPVPRHLDSKLSYDPALEQAVEYFGPGERLQMVWEIDFQPPLALSIRSDGCGLMVGSRRLPLPRWLYLQVDYAVMAESAHSNVVQIHMRLSHPWLGEVFGYDGRFQQSLRETRRVLQP